MIQMLEKRHELSVIITKVLIKNEINKKTMKEERKSIKGK